MIAGKPRPCLSVIGAGAPGVCSAGLSYISAPLRPQADVLYGNQERGGTSRLNVVAVFWRKKGGPRSPRVQRSDITWGFSFLFSSLDTDSSFQKKKLDSPLSHLELRSPPCRLLSLLLLLLLSLK